MTTITEVGARMTTITDVSTLVVLSCASCGIRFAIPQKMDAERRRDHKMFWCPSGHENYFPWKSEAEKLRDELTRERALRDQVQARADMMERRVELKERQVRARKAVATRLRNRIQKGRCPCCRSQFADLAAHMSRHHPDWSPEKHAKALAAKEPRA